MAEHGEIVAGASGIGALMGAFFGAWKLFKPKTGDDMTAALQRIAVLENRADECDAREVERHSWRADVYGRLLELDKNTSKILAILDERREKR